MVIKNKSVSIRQYQIEDTRHLASIYYNTIHNVNANHYSESQLNAWAPESSKEPKNWVKKFEKTSPFVATYKGKIVGFAEFEQDGHIDCFYCHHNWIGKKIGSALMKAIYNQAQKHKINRIFAEVSITAKPFFEKQGFKIVTKQTVELRGQKLINYKMEKLLELSNE